MRHSIGTYTGDLKHKSVNTHYRSVHQQTVHRAYKMHSVYLSQVRIFNVGRS